MKRNLVRLLVWGAVAIAIGLYLHRNNERLNNGPVPQKITCVNNLKQIGLAFRIWEGDHGDQYPFNVSTNAGGALELCSPDKDGFDRNAWLYLKTMTNDDELTVPLLLICPRPFQEAGRQLGEIAGNECLLSFPLRHEHH